MFTEAPLYLTVLFGLVTAATLLLFSRAIKNSQDPAAEKNILVIVLVQLGWLILQAVLAINKVYSTHLDALPPRLLVLGILPPILFIVLLLLTKRGRAFIDGLPLRPITWINTVRVFVELALFGLYLNKAVPKLMTFEGGNLDILSGLTAPLIVYFGFAKGRPHRNLLLVWNIICLALLTNIVIRALLSTPLPIQKLAFDQPNVGILIFPFVWLPTFVVPIVLFGHLVSIRQLIRTKI